MLVSLWKRMLYLRIGAFLKHTILCTEPLFDNIFVFLQFLHLSISNFITYVYAVVYRLCKPSEHFRLTGTYREPIVATHTEIYVYDNYQFRVSYITLDLT